MTVRASIGHLFVIEKEPVPSRFAVLFALGSLAPNRVIEQTVVPGADSPAGVWIGHDAVYVSDGTHVIPVRIEGGP